MQTVDQSVAFEHGFHDCRIKTLVNICFGGVDLFRTKRSDDLITDLDVSICYASLEGMIVDLDSRSTVT